MIYGRDKFCGIKHAGSGRPWKTDDSRSVLAHRYLSNDIESHHVLLKDCAKFNDHFFFL